MSADYASEIERGIVVVIEAARSVRGFLAGWPEPDAYFIESIAVDPVWQGRGFGRKLIAFAIDEARRRGLTAVRLYTNEAMIENISMYERMGFVETHRGMHDGFGRVFMRWSR